MKTIAFSISLALLAITTSALADLVIEQASITGQADYGTGQGQSFLLPSGKPAAPFSCTLVLLAVAEEASW